MTDFNPGPEWREVQYQQIEKGQRHLITVDSDLADRPDQRRYWVREVPVPPLPIEPYTVIRVEWRDVSPQHTVFTLEDKDWSNSVEGMFISAEDLVREITDFEVLASPSYQTPPEVWNSIRRETAKAVLDRVERDGWEASPEVWREFGVES